MSGLIQALVANPFLGMGGHQGNTDVLQSVDYRVSYLDFAPSNDAARDSDILWPRSSFTGQDYATIAPIWDSCRQHWEWNWFLTGGHVAKKISGVTLNSAGAPLGNAVVQLFNTATGLLVDTQTSDSSGNYVCSDPNAVACFVVAYEGGSPDVAGTTNNNLIGT